MKIRARIALSEKAARHVPESWKLPLEVKYGVAVITLFTDDKRYNELTYEFSKHDVQYNEERTPIFDEDEMDNAEYYHMVPRAQWGYPEPQSNYGEDVYDHSSGCKKCGKGFTQKNPFAVKGPPRFNRNDIVAMFWTYELLVTPELRQLISHAGLSGVEFRPLHGFSRSVTTRPIDGASQLYITSTLCPMSPNTEFPIVKRLPKGAEPCECGRIGRNIPLQLRYKRGDIECVKDFNKTSEWLGGGLDTAPLKVVSRSTYELFDKHKIRGVDFEPVVVEE